MTAARDLEPVRKPWPKKSPERRAWTAMRRRCYNPSVEYYPAYGGRGIRVCDRWQFSFAAFLEDVGPRPGPGYSLGRIDNDGNYEPGNVRWETPAQQSNNRRANVWYELDGKRQTLTEWARELNLSVSTITKRLERGWTLAEALTPDRYVVRRRRVA